MLLLDVTPLSLGIETMGGIMSKLINKNTTIPTKTSQVYSTADDNQPAVTIRVHQGEREMAQHNKMLGEFNLEGIDPAPRGMPQIEVTFDIDANGILTVSAKDKKTGKANNITIKANSGLTEEEIAKMVREAEENAEADKKQRELIETRNTTEHQIWGVEKKLKEHGDKLLDEQRTAIDEQLKKLREVIAGDDVDAMQKAMEEALPKFMPLMEISQKAEAASTAEVNPAPQTESSDAKDENVVEAEFTEVKDNK